MGQGVRSEEKKILIINCYSSSWYFIPMGTFGLCDYLRQQGIKAKIFNAALYGKNEYLQELRLIIKKYNPGYIGLILHWKELLENHIFLSNEIKSAFPGIKIIAGGMTAGFLGKELLSRFDSIDYVIKGDSEEPLRLLIAQEDPSKIPNLMYRDKNTIKINDCTYIADSKILDAIAYSKLHYLIDYKKYLETIKAGFPLFIGRGCVYDCLYCGGSKKAFRVHSNREYYVNRSIDSVLRDLKLLQKYTDSIFIDYEPDIQYLYDLFSAILSERRLAKKFRLGYSGWHLMDSKLIDLYSKAFKFDENKKTSILISPETSIERDRKIVRDKSLFFSNAQMFESVKEISEKLGRFVEIIIYFSRYHVTHTNKQVLMEELKFIHGFKERAYTEEKCKITIDYADLSTDVGCAYWDAAFKGMARSSAIDFLLEYSKKNDLCSAYDFKKENLCLFTPKSLDKSTQFKYEQLVAWSGLLEQTVPAYYFGMTKVLGFDRFVRLLEDLINVYASSKKWYFFRDIKISLLVDMINNEIKKKYRATYKRNPVFFDGLIILIEKYLNTPYDGKEDIQLCCVKRPVLDTTRICVSPYNYTSKTFYNSLHGDMGNVRRNKTLHVFCGAEIHAFGYKYYQAFKLLNGKNTWEEIFRKIQRSNLFAQKEVEGLCDFFLKYRYNFIL